MKATILTSTAGLTRDEWLEYRRKGIGGSDAAAICGISRWKDPFSVWMDKMGRVTPAEPSEAMYWGSTLEGVVRKEFSRRTGLKVRQVHAILQHPDVPYLLANVDGTVTDKQGKRGIFEAKTANAFLKCEWDAEKVPDEYMLQVQHYMMVTGLSFAYVAVLIGGSEFRYQRLARDEEMIAMIQALEMDFWEKQVVRDIPPDPTATSSDLLQLLYPDGKKEALILPESSLELVEEFQRHQEQEKEAKRRKEEAAAKLKALMGNHEAAKVDGYTLSWKSVITERFDTKSFREAHPDLAEGFLQKSESRRFTVKTK